MIYDTFDSLNKTVSIPIRYANGKIEYFYGGKLPKLKDGVIGELILPAYALEDKKFLENISKEVIVDFLPSGKYLGYSADHVYKLKDDIFIEGIHFNKRGKLLFDRIEIDKWVIGADTSNKRQELKNNIDAILNSVLHKKK